MKKIISIRKKSKPSISNVKVIKKVMSLEEIINVAKQMNVKVDFNDLINGNKLCFMVNLKSKKGD